MATYRKHKTKAGRNRVTATVRLIQSSRSSISDTFDTVTEAKAWAADVESGIKTGRLVAAIEAERHTLADAIKKFELKGAPAYRLKLATYLAWWKDRLGHLTLAVLSPADISEGRDKLARTRSGPTANRYLSGLSVVLGAAEREWLWLDRNPCRKVRRAREHQPRARCLSDDERDALLAACEASPNRRLYPLVVLALYTGARVGELLSLRWCDIEGTRATLHKTKNRERRSINFQGHAVEVLRSMPRYISGYVFANPQGKPTFPAKAWRRARTEAKLENFRFHDLRHTAASYLAVSGASVPEIAHFLGHKTFHLAARYAHLTGEHSAAVQSKMTDRFLR